MTNPHGKWELLSQEQIPSNVPPICEHPTRFRIYGALNGCMICQCEEEARLKREAREELEENKVKLTSVYAVGSQEHGKIIFDFISSNREQASAYCESRKNNKYDWTLWEVPLGGRFIDWKFVHRTKKIR